MILLFQSSPRPGGRIEGQEAPIGILCEHGSGVVHPDQLTLLVQLSVGRCRGPLELGLQFLEELEAELERPSAPAHAKLNEQGQLVWVDDSGTVFAQNPDGSLLTFDVATGSWTPLE